MLRSYCICTVVLTGNDHGGSTGGSVLYNYDFRDECMSPLLTCVKEDKCVSVTSGKHGVTGFDNVLY